MRPNLNVPKLPWNLSFLNFHSLRWAVGNLWGSGAMLWGDNAHSHILVTGRLRGGAICIYALSPKLTSSRSWWWLVPLSSLREMIRKDLHQKDMKKKTGWEPAPSLHPPSVFLALYVKPGYPCLQFLLLRKVCPPPGHSSPWQGPQEAGFFRKTCICFPTVTQGIRSSDVLTWNKQGVFIP